MKSFCVVYYYYYLRLLHNGTSHYMGVSVLYSNNWKVILLMAEFVLYWATNCRFWFIDSTSLGRKFWKFIWKMFLLQSQSRNITLDYFIRSLNLPPKVEEEIGGWEPNFVLNLRLNFRVLTRPYRRQVVPLISQTAHFRAKPLY